MNDQPDERYTYYASTTVSGSRIVGVFRWYDGPDDSRAEVWRDGGWEVDNDYARYIFMGETSADQISEAQANALIGDLVARRR